MTGVDRSRVTGLWTVILRYRKKDRRHLGPWWRAEPVNIAAPTAELAIVIAKKRWSDKPERLDPEVLQIHSIEYRGEVIVTDEPRNTGQ